MHIDKNQIQEIMMGILDELPLRTDDPGEISEGEIAFIRSNILNALPDILMRALMDSEDVVCQMPYNIEVISKYDSVQCANCTKYFCRRHKLSVCPKCGANL